MASFMKIRVLAFGIARDITNADTIILELPAGSKAGALQAHLQELFPAFKRLNTLRIAVNAEYADPDTLLRENDEIALIPPVSGG